MAKGIAKSRPANSMKLTALLLLAMTAYAKAAPPDVGLTRFLACIQAVEQTPANPYGLTPEVWKQEKMEGSYLCSHSLQEVCARRHLRTLRDQIRGVHAHADVYELAVCWLRGFDGGMDVLEGDVNDAIARDYGSRVNNLYCDRTFDPASLPTL